MFNVSLKLRDAEGFVTPKGPCFSSARIIRSEIDGTQIEFKAPQHQIFRGAREQYEPKKYIQDDGHLFRSDYDGEDEAKGREDHWLETNFFVNSWAFNGPWFTGNVSSLHLSFRLLKIVNYPEAVSLFHPRALEKVIGDRLSFMYSSHILKHHGNIQQYNAPIDWKPLTHLPVNAARLGVVTQSFFPYDFRQYVFFPISDNILGCMLFLSSRTYGSKTKAELDKLIDERPLLELTDNIINSLQLTLSPKAQAQQEAALKGLDDTSLTDNYPILKWDNLGEDEKLKIITEQKRLRG